MKVVITDSINKEDDSEQKIFLSRNKIISLINGILYFVVAVDGGQNIKDLFGINGKTADIMIYSAGIGASLVYTMFTYKTLESLSLKINSLPKKLLSFLAPFSAAAFLTAGEDGARLIGCNDGAAITLGISLFLLRIINCIDASVKFPDRLLETKKAWNESWSIGDYREITRLIVIWIASIGYVVCTTDAIFGASQTICGWLHIPPEVSEPLSYISCILGAIGTLPLNVYWSYRGLRQLTFGGKINPAGENPDPTDRYTYLGLALVTPVMLGILGGATAATGEVFGRLGSFSQILRVATSIFYAACAGTPGMATLLRSASLYVKTSCRRKGYELAPLLDDEKEENERTVLSSNSQSSFGAQIIHRHSEADAAQVEQKKKWSLPCSLL